MSPGLAQVSNNAPKIARKSDLFKITHCRTSLKGCEGLSRLGRFWLAYYVELVLRDYEEIQAPMGAICHAQWLAVGHTASLSSAYRAHNELEKHGFIKRVQCRLGKDSKLSIIEIIHERFKFWINCYSKNSPNSKSGEVSDKTLHMSKCETYEFTSNPSKLQTSNPDSLSLNCNKSKKHAKNEKPKTKFDSWTNPVLYTIGVVLRADRDRDGRRLYSLARSILVGKNQCLDLREWTPDRWWTMTHSEREYCARTLILPQLKQVGKMPKPDKRIEEVIQAITGRYERPKELDSAVERLLGARTSSEAPPLEYSEDMSRAIQAIDADELAVLKAAKARIEYRRAQEKQREKLNL